MNHQPPKDQDEVLDLVDEMQWEDSPKVEKVTIEEAGFEESNHTIERYQYSVYEYMEWFYDGELPGYSE